MYVGESPKGRVMLHLRYTHVTFAEDEQTRKEGEIAFKCIMRCFINCVYLGLDYI